MVMNAVNLPFEQAPDAFNAIRVDDPVSDVLAFAVDDRLQHVIRD